MDELRACPFCGGVAQEDKYAELTGCPKCDYWVDTPEEFNTRPLEDALTATIKEQGELIDMMAKALKAASEFYVGREAVEAEAVYRQWKEKQK